MLSSTRTLTIPSCTCIVSVTTSSHLSQCVVDIGHWMAANRLQMNPAKTELLWAGTKYNVSLLDGHAPTLQLGSDTVTPSTCSGSHHLI